jgi:hypothetical protein
MPAKSESQRRLIYGKFGAEFAKRHHFDNPGKLPEKLKAGKTNVGLAMFRAMQKAKKK